MIKFLRFLPVRMDAAGETGGGAAGGAGGEGGQGGEGGGAAGTAGGEGGQAGAKTYDEDYVKQLRQEAANYRIKAKDLETQLNEKPNEITANILKALGIDADPNKEFSKQLEEAKKAGETRAALADQKLINAELKLLCKDLNIVDPDAAFALMKKDGVKVDEAGNVTGLKEALEELIKGKSYLVGQAQGGGFGNGTNPAGQGGTPTGDQLGGMTMAEYMAAREKMK